MAHGLMCTHQPASLAVKSDFIVMLCVYFHVCISRRVSYRDDLALNTLLGAEASLVSGPA